MQCGRNAGSLSLGRVGVKVTALLYKGDLEIEFLLCNKSFPIHDDRSGSYQLPSCSKQRGSGGLALSGLYHVASSSQDSKHA